MLIDIFSFDRSKSVLVWGVEEFGVKWIGFGFVIFFKSLKVFFDVFVIFVICDWLFWFNLCWIVWGIKGCGIGDC